MAAVPVSPLTERPAEREWEQTLAFLTFPGASHLGIAQDSQEGCGTCFFPTLKPGQSTQFVTPSCEMKMWGPSFKTY